MFDPKTNKFPYPEKTDEHYLIVKKNNGAVFDGKYPYVDRSRSFRRRQRWVRLLLRLVVFPLAKVRLGLRIKAPRSLPLLISLAVSDLTVLPMQAVLAEHCSSSSSLPSCSSSLFSVLLILR